MTPEEAKEIRNDFVRRREEVMNPTDPYDKLWFKPVSEWTEEDKQLYFRKGIESWLIANSRIKKQNG